MAMLLKIKNFFILFKSKTKTFASDDETVTIDTEGLIHRRDGVKEFPPNTIENYNYFWSENGERLDAVHMD